MRDETDVCQYLHAHDEAVARAQSEQPEEAALARLAELYGVFSDATRLRILFALLGRELCVCDISRLLSVSQSAVSHQLRVLRQAALVKARREGKAAFYALADEHVHTILAQGMEHILE